MLALHHLAATIITLAKPYYRLILLTAGFETGNGLVQEWILPPGDQHFLLIVTNDSNVVTKAFLPHAVVGGAFRRIVAISPRGVVINPSHNRK